MTNDEIKDLLREVISSAKQVNVMTGDHAQAIYNESEKRAVPEVFLSSPITEESASELDWEQATNGFDLNCIKRIVQSTGQSNSEKLIVIKAIFDAIFAKGEAYNIPYNVDGLLDKLHRLYDKEHRGIIETYYPRREHHSLLSSESVKKAKSLIEIVKLMNDISKIGTSQPMGTMPNIIVNGDFVLNKTVQHEVNGVQAGGTGINVTK